MYNLTNSHCVICRDSEIWRGEKGEKKGEKQYRTTLVSFSSPPVSPIN